MTEPDPIGGQKPDADPDARFLLANERTLLAWLRTALAMQAGGVGVLQFVTRVEARAAIGLSLLGLGALAAVVGYLRYRSADAALRGGRLPATGIGPVLVAWSVIALAAVLAGGYLLAELRGG
jgi:putative membrane protein